MLFLMLNILSPSWSSSAYVWDRDDSLLPMFHTRLNLFDAHSRMSGCVCTLDSVAHGLWCTISAMATLLFYSFFYSHVGKEPFIIDLIFYSFFYSHVGKEPCIIDLIIVFHSV